jgi:hypothetical protein
VICVSPFSLSSTTLRKFAIRYFILILFFFKDVSFAVLDHAQHQTSRRKYSKPRDNRSCEKSNVTVQSDAKRVFKRTSYDSIKFINKYHMQRKAEIRSAVTEYINSPPLSQPQLGRSLLVSMCWAKASSVLLHG